MCAVAQKKKDADVMTNYKPVEFSASCFLQGRLSLLRLQPSTLAFLYSRDLTHQEAAGSVTPWPVAAGAWSREGGEGGCPRAGLLSRAQSLN